ncbi:Sugar kinase of the NBD/HSP70 family, may contain an N-terminal HTH domain [Cryobacterium flavum]|uniref:ROK family protein n=1 Tax=Cryobacterium flavum TaxID=1424659 RepID=A0A4R8VG33_9MICO|nr:MULTISPECIES: ROK family protein [Cryobacterium]TFB81222.1 ROK family protein [Cryobacterium flavum]SDM69874.1 Sugar kinase of the NBD/HSP70 family, may contain an N-terminal HTH domain [Cryobacterium flavum]
MAHAMSTGSGVVLDLIRAGLATTRPALIDELGWSRITLARRLDELLAAGIIIVAGQSDSRGGRPAESFAINTDAGLLLSVDIGGSHTRVAVTDLVSTILIEDQADIGLWEGPDTVFTWANQVFDYLLRQLGKTRADVRGIGVGVPGPVDAATGRLAAPQIDAQWNDVLVQDYFSADYTAIFAVDRDVNIMAVAESRLGWPEHRDLTVLKVGLGIGCALVLDGRVYRGARGGAGDFSHSFRYGDELCSCGQRGCLEAVASGYAIRRELNALGYRIRTTGDIVALSRMGSPDAVRLLAAAGAEIGNALVDVAGLLNPAMIVIGGQLAEAGDPYLSSVREALLAHVRAFSGTGLTVEPSRLGNKAGVLGASLIAQDALFEADRISHLTR